MASETALSLLKQKLLLATNSYNDVLSLELDAAKERIIQEGASSLDENNTSDLALIVDYAEYNYRLSHDTDQQKLESKKRMIRWCINNRVFQDKMTEEDDES